MSFRSLFLFSDCNVACLFLQHGHILDGKWNETGNFHHHQLPSDGSSISEAGGGVKNLLLLFRKVGGGRGEGVAEFAENYTKKEEIWPTWKQIPTTLSPPLDPPMLPFIRVSRDLIFLANADRFDQNWLLPVFLKMSCTLLLLGSVHTELLAIALSMPKKLSMVPFTLALAKSLVIAMPVEKDRFLLRILLRNG